MTITASLRPAVYELRWHVGCVYPGPYHGSGLVLRRGDLAEIRALTVQGGFTVTHWDAVLAALQAERFAWAEWERRTGDQVRLVRRAV